MYKRDVIIIGGGAAGFFTAINIAMSNPQIKILILERAKEVLAKVRISGGGRCNVTHAEFVPLDLTENYPRGKKELLGPFHTFMTGDTIAWFEAQGISLKIEGDGRMFPESDTSQTIIDCFTGLSHKYDIEVWTQCGVEGITFLPPDANDLHARKEDTKEDSQPRYTLHTKKGTFQTGQLVIATGSSPKMWRLLKDLGHHIVSAVPSLFTFNIKDSRIEGLMGVSKDAQVEVIGTPLEAHGPLLITHWGMSGPGILKLSAWGARWLSDKKYRFEIVVNWIGRSILDAAREIDSIKKEAAKQSPYTHTQFDVPKRLWHRLLEAAYIYKESKWADITKDQAMALATELTRGVFKVDGKSTFKEEFVTAGGVALHEIHFKTYESRLLPGVYLVGEVLNIDAVTGGFNFQNAWTGGYIAAQAITKHYENLYSSSKRD